MKDSIIKDKIPILRELLENYTQTKQPLWDQEIISCYTLSVKKLYLSLQKLPKNKATYAFLYLLAHVQDFAYYELISTLNPEYNDFTVVFLEELKSQPENWQSLLLKYHLERTVKGFRYHDYIFLTQ